MNRFVKTKYLRNDWIEYISYLTFTVMLLVGMAPVNSVNSAQIQVGAFSDRSNANDRKDTLEQWGYRVRIQQNAEGLNRVRIVELSDSATSEVLQRLKKEGLPHFTLKEPPPEEQFEDGTKQIIDELPELRFGLQTRLSEDIRERLDEAMGTPYVWGGESFSEGGFDCSGLLVWLLEYDDLPRTSRMQWRWTETVDERNMRPGDFIFFNFQSTNRPDHVGLYLGNNRFVHASSTYGVIKANFKKAYYQKNLWGIGRPP